MDIHDGDLNERNSDVDIANNINPFRESPAIYEKLYTVIKSTFESNRVRLYFFFNTHMSFRHDPFLFSR